MLSGGGVPGRRSGLRAARERLASRLVRSLTKIVEPRPGAGELGFVLPLAGWLRELRLHQGDRLLKPAGRGVTLAPSDRQFGPLLTHQRQ